MPHLDLQAVSDEVDVLMASVAALQRENEQQTLQIQAAGAALSTVMDRYNLLQQQLDDHQHQHAVTDGRPNPDIVAIVARLKRLEMAIVLPPAPE